MTDDDRSETIFISLQSITRGAGLFYIGQILLNVISFISNLILTRGLGSGLFGIYTYGTTLIAIIVNISLLGTGKSVLRFLPEYNEKPRQQKAVLGLAYLTAISGSLVLGAILYMTAPFITNHTLRDQQLTDVLRILAIVLPFNTLANLTSSVFRGNEQLEYQVLVDNIISPIVRLIFIGTALLLGFSLIGVTLATVIVGVSIFIVALATLVYGTKLYPDITQPYSEKRQFYSFSLPLTFRDMGDMLYTRIDILMVGFFLVDNSVGIYKISVVLSAVLAIPLAGFNQIFVPVASRLYSNNDKNELMSVFSIITRWTLTLSIIPTLIIIIYSNEVLAVFGSDFTKGSMVLFLLAIAQIANIASGPNDSVLMMTNHQYVSLVNQWSIGILNTILNYIFIQQFGLIGAALASATVLVTMNILRLGQVWYLEQLFPYSFVFWKPLAASIGASVAMIYWESILNGYTLLLVGSGSGLATYSVLLFVFGIEDKDKELISKVL